MLDKFIVIDTETANSLEEPLCYDVSYIVCDMTGKVYERKSFVVADLFVRDKELLSTAYYFSKMPIYQKALNRKTAELKTFNSVYWDFRKTVKEYNVKVVVAHNAAFDVRSLTLSQRYFSKSKKRYFLPYKIQVWDSLKMGKEVFYKDEDYISFCEKNNFLTTYKKPKLTAEVLHRYLTKDTSFEEAHTGLKDALIEKDIFLECLKRKPNIDGRLYSK